MHGNHSVRVKGRKRILPTDKSATESLGALFDASSSALEQEVQEKPLTETSFRLPFLGKKATVEKAAAKKEEIPSDTTSLISRFPQLTLAVPVNDSTSASEAWGNQAVATGRLFEASKPNAQEPSAPRPSRTRNLEELNVVDVEEENGSTTTKPGFGFTDNG